ncbi:hypothetical protein [Kallipyga gabonensis]|uniref:hypothetical protein n=1 Tax=Kallipyga gabonensis TaxID=1686287 RepID=UPI0006B56B95|nr:hypothetical protein [Kallipyga gabonensis]
MKKITTNFRILLVILLFFIVSSQKASANEAILKSSTESHFNNKPTYSLLNLEKRRFNEFSELLVSNLKASNETDYSKVIRESYETYMNSISIEWSEPNSLIKDIREYNFQEMVNKNEGFFRICDLNDYDTVIITPYYVILDELKIEDEQIVLRSPATRSRFATNTRTGYGYLGNKLFDVTVECAFYYNGNSAWYKSDFDYYYTRGTLSLWQVNNWRGWKEFSGTSYKANCSGNFHFGVEYEGNGLIIQELYCKNSLTCTKDGSIIKNTDWR